MGSAAKNVKITVVGDGMVGKTCLLYTYIMKTFPEEYVPTVFDNYSEKITVDGQEYSMALWDTAGQEDYERLRPLSYPHTTCFLICFSVSGRASYENVATKWAPEVRHHVPHASIILVGTKIDIRDDPYSVTISQKEGKRLKNKIRAQMYMECSALKFIGLNEIFEAAVRCSLKKPKPKQRTCKIL